MLGRGAQAERQLGRRALAEALAQDIGLQEEASQRGETRSGPGQAPFQLEPSPQLLEKKTGEEKLQRKKDDKELLLFPEPVQGP